MADRKERTVTVKAVICCQFCGKEVESRAYNRKFCSELCGEHARAAAKQEANHKEKHCLECGIVFTPLKRGETKRKYCSQRCAKRHNSKNIKGWIANHPRVQKTYNETRLARNPKAWTDKVYRDRTAVLEILGGMCIVCGVTNRNWLHVDYIPTTRNVPHRHPRHLGYIREHQEDFRILCANHHYELTLTGKIEGTDITQ